MTTYTWEEREAILKSMETVPRTEKALTAALAELDRLGAQYQGDPDILSLGESLYMDLTGLRWEEQQRAPGGPTEPRRGA